MWVKTQIFLDEYKNLDLLKEALCHEYCLGNPYVYFQLIMSHRHILLINGFAFSDKKKGGFRIFVNTLMASRYPFGITSNCIKQPCAVHRSEQGKMHLSCQVMQGSNLELSYE